MKVCHIIDIIPTHHKKIGGAEWAAYRMVKAQKKYNKKIESFIITSKRTKTPEKTDIKTYEAPTRLEGVISKIRMGLYPFDKKLYRFVKEILEKEKPDIVHVHTLKYFGFSTLKAIKDQGLKVVYSVYDYWFFCTLSSLYIKKENKICRSYHGAECRRCIGPAGYAFGLRKNIFDRYIKLIDWFAVISNDSKKILIDNKIPSDRITVSSLILETPKKTGKTKRIKNSILFVGWVVQHKGLEVLIKGLKGTDYRLFVIGDMTTDPAYVKRCRQAAEELNVDVEFIGRTPHKTVIDYMRKCEYLAVPSQWRIPLPTVLLEGMSIGSKIIGSDVGSISEHLPKQNIFKNSREIKRCLKNAKFVKKRFDNRKTANEMVKLYRSILES